MKKAGAIIVRVFRVIIKSVLFSIVAILVLLVLAELVLRLLGHSYQRKLLASAKDFDPKNINVLCLGESTTAGLWVEPEESYPSQLEKKLREYYGSGAIKLIAPPHIGQNTSQISHRLGRYLKTYHPRLIIVMAGINNEWALGESSVVRLLGLDSREKRRIKLLIFLNNLRVFKALRYVFIRFKLSFPKTLDQTYFHPDNVLGRSDVWHYPPEDWIYEFASSHHEAFAKGWEYDLEAMIREARRDGVNVLLMTYHSSMFYLPEGRWESFARDQGVDLVRNDLTFDKLRERGVLDQYILAKDHWHPNGRGYEVIAQNAFQRIIERGLLGLTK